MVRNVSAIVIREKHDLWAIYGVEFDVWTQGTSLAEARYMLRDILALTFDVPIGAFHVGQISYRTPLWYNVAFRD